MLYTSAIYALPLYTPLIVLIFLANEASLRSFNKLCISLWVLGGYNPYKLFLTYGLTPEPKVNIFALKLLAS